jgi:hypothetical protein
MEGVKQCPYKSDVSTYKRFCCKHLKDNIKLESNSFVQKDAAPLVSNILMLELGEEELSLM